MSLVRWDSKLAYEVALDGLAFGVLITIVTMLYNAFMHPLRKFPGPFSHRVSVIPRAVYQMRGALAFHVAELHNQYGDVVRVAPNELAFSSLQAVRDIYKKNGQGQEFPKYKGFYKVFDHLPSSIINADAVEHGMLRRQLAVGFSDRAMREQEPIIKSYVDLLMQRLRENIEKSPATVLNMTDWYDWTLFDLIGDLSFGVDGGFGCLENTSYHPWVRTIHESLRQQGIMQGLMALGLRNPIAWLHKYASIFFVESEHRLIVKEKVAIRMRGGQRPDFLDGLIRNKEELGLDEGRIAMNASILILAGSETTATETFANMCRILTTHPEILEKLKHEIRSVFTKESNITLSNLDNLPLTILTSYQYAINRDKRYWTEPDKFAPERWTNDTDYKKDQLYAMQPFGIGPRNCIGRNLAYAEMRLILARLIYNFDMEIADDSRFWLKDQKAYVGWHKPKLDVHMRLA
ncbi:putative cytochrome P450 [Xylariaceae sp. FL1019]|nr:putative cytochrome P450 [Xylariaceae sp. FL1019]